MAYVANDFKQKGTAKWVPMSFVGISVKKQYILLHGKTMRVTRSIKRIFPDASQHLAAYKQILVCSWMCEGVVGTKLRPSTAKHLWADTGQDLDLEDEAALDPEDYFNAGSFCPGTWRTPQPITRAVGVFRWWCLSTIRTSREHCKWGCPYG